MGKQTALLCLLLAVWGSARSDPAPFEPFRFKNDARRFVEAVRFPDVAADLEVEIKYEGWFERGRTRALRCDGARSFERFHYATTRAGTRFLRGSTARIGKRRVIVNVPFRVRFVQEKGRRSVEVFPNHGELADVHGEHYLGPQEVERQRLAVRSQCDGDLEATFEIETSASRGTPNRVTSTGRDPGAACVKSVERMLMDKEYLPGFVDERPVAMLRTVRFSRDIEWATGTLGKEPSYIESTLRGLERGRRPRRQ